MELCDKVFFPRTREFNYIELAYRGRSDLIASPDQKMATSQDLKHMSLPAGLDSNGLRAGALDCLMAVPFVHSVIQLGQLRKVDAVLKLAGEYGLDPTSACRNMEAVQVWLRALGYKFD